MSRLWSLKLVSSALLFAFLAMTPSFAEGSSTAEARQLNNKGVTFLKEGKLAESERAFLDALKLRPGYFLAIENLAILYNNIALTKQGPEALQCFRLSALLNQENKTVHENLNQLQQSLGSDPSSFSAVVAIADKCSKSGDTVGAIVEYRRALQLKSDKAVEAKLDSLRLPAKWDALLRTPMTNDAAADPPPKDDHANQSAADRSAGRAGTDSMAKPSEPPGVDYGPYMADLQRRIRSHWTPPRSGETKHATVLFKIQSDGSLLDRSLKIDKSSGSKVSDAAALSAVLAAAPFHALPAGSPPSVDIQFAFQYNVGGAHEASATDGSRIATNVPIRPSTPLVKPPQTAEELAKAERDATISHWLPFVIFAILAGAVVLIVRDFRAQKHF